jgi:hypothetical protein
MALHQASTRVAAGTSSLGPGQLRSLRAGGIECAHTHRGLRPLRKQTAVLCDNAEKGVGSHLTVRYRTPPTSSLHTSRNHVG